jgi:hypothetical protein
VEEKKMNILKSGLRFWITSASILSFVGGWIMLVHAPKPASLIAQNTNTTAPPTLEPLPPLFGQSNNTFQNQQPLFSVQPQQRFGGSPFFRTGGS